jgi:hypothetical protein
MILFHYRTQETIPPVVVFIHSSVPVSPGPFFSFVILYRVSRAPWAGDPPTHRINAHTSMPRMRLEPTTPVFERAKTVHALVHAAIGVVLLTKVKVLC